MVRLKGGTGPCWTWFIEYPKETMGYYFYDPLEQKVFVSRNTVFLGKDFSLDSRRDEILVEESSEVSHETSETTSMPIVPADSVSVLRRSARVTQPPERFGFVSLTSQLDKDPKTYGEAMLDIDSDKWLEAMKYEMDLMGSNQVWTRVDPPKSVKPIGRKWVYKYKLRAEGEVTTFKMGVKTTFFNGFVEEEIYMDQPEGFTSAGEKQNVRLLQTSIYSLNDASFKSDDDDAKSQSGYDFKLNGGVVAWKSSKQAIMADSTTKSDYIAASEAAKEVVWMKNYINGAIAQAKERRSHHRFNHILRQYHLHREMVSRGDAWMDRVSSAENIADPLTKLVSQITHTQHLDKASTSRMGIERPMETCIKSRIHWMSAAFHRRQTWDVYAILMGRLTKCQVN
ncbi:UNVERIFIED_CONTAM: Retrovirus-related Pol polyprotein from transposon TNT 1-94 [Sesamum latifolium]|uniref:Retrovirus-related Pol polyprotein from transposon TNT 1-94 n=1 Tax=Sesamum latifolium TaxID=2727402 RepID=A0AAW2YBH9_9LAMI